MRLSDGASLLCNPAYTRMTGHTAEELKGKTAKDVQLFVDPEVRAAWMERLRHEARVVNQEARIRTKSGEIRDAMASLSLVEVGGEPAVMIVATDVTERRRAEEALRQSEGRFRHVFESANVGKSITLLDGTISVNQAFADWLGYRPAELVGKSWQEITPPEDIPRVLAILEPLTGGEEDAARFTKRYVRKDGALVWGDVSVALQRDEGGKALYFITTVVDITDRVRAEHERHKLAMLIDSSSEFIGMCDLELQPIYVNPAGMRMVGLPDMAAACRVRVPDYFFPEDQPFIEEQFFPRVLREGHGDVEIRLRHFRTGEPIWMYYYLFSVRDAEGTAVGWATVSRDITDRKRAAEELARGEERLRLSTELAGVAVWEFDFMTNSMSRSRNHDRLYGLEWQEVWRFETFLEATHPDDRERSLRFIADAVAPGGPDRYEFDFRAVTPEGEIRWLSVVGQVVLRDSEGRGVTVRGCLQDITSRKAAEEALRSSEERFQMAFHSSPAGLTITRIADGRFVEANDSFLEMFGFGRREVIGHTSTELGMWTPEARAQLIARQLESGGLREFEMQARSKSGTPVEILFSSAPVEIDGIPHHVTTMVDISSRRAAEAEVHRMNAELEERVRERTARLEAANDELSAFTYSVSHDLRAPIRSIDGWAAILAEEAGLTLDTTGQEHLARIRSEARRMGALIDDLLRLSRLGRAEVRFAAVDLSEMAARVAARLRATLPDRNIDVSIEGGLTATGDPALLEVLLENLLSNAFKFSATRPITRVAVGRRHEGAPCLFVKDNGVGFPTHLAGRLFRPFTRLHSEEEFPGTGIGLATVERIVRLHGGQVWAESEVDQGATLCFTLPGPGVGAAGE